MITLRSDEILLRLDPLHGGEILDLVDLSTGRQLLARPPFASLEPLGGDLDENAWTNRYRGGWQTVTPNAGNACIVGAAHHGFHGRASNDPWEIVDATASAATLRWSGHGLLVTRSLTLAHGSVVVETDWAAVATTTALVSVEHIALGLELLAPTATLRLPGGTAFELSESDGPTRPPARVRDWPDVLLLDGMFERADTFSVEEPGGRFLVVESLPEGWYEVVNDLTGQGLRIEWDVTALPHLWLWREVRQSGGPWRGQAEILALEPASVPHSLGLARALAEEQAIVLEPGELFRSRIAAIPFHRCSLLT